VDAAGEHLRVAHGSIHTGQCSDAIASGTGPCDANEARPATHRLTASSGIASATRFHSARQQRKVVIAPSATALRRMMLIFNRRAALTMFEA
jgi:hypothetical protein